jgi:CNT family concentrative nucleoside transporter
MDTFVHVGRGLLGLVAFIGIALCFSSNRRAVPWRLVVGDGVADRLWSARAESGFRPRGSGHGRAVLREDSGFQHGRRRILRQPDHEQAIVRVHFAFNVLPTIIFFPRSPRCCSTSILQRIVFVFAWVMTKTMNLSGAESLNALANIFRPDRAPLLIKPYLATTTLRIARRDGRRMATIAGAVMVAYIRMLGGDSPEGQLPLQTSAHRVGDVGSGRTAHREDLLPQTEAVNRNLEVPRENRHECPDAAKRQSDGLRLAVNVGAMLLVFTAMVAFLNWIPSAGIGGWSWAECLIARDRRPLHGIFAQYILGMIFAPLAWLMGIESGNLMLAGQIIGEKTILTNSTPTGRSPK